MNKFELYCLIFYTMQTEWELQKKIPNLKANIYGAIKRSNIKGWN